MPRRRCSVEGCDRVASPTHTWCPYHRRNYAQVPQREELQRPDDADLVPTGMLVHNDAAVLELLGGLRIPAPANLSLTYFYGELDRGRAPLLLPSNRVRRHLQQLRDILAKGGVDA